MDAFAFIIHPIDPKRDISRKFPWLGRMANDWMIDHLAPLFPPVYLSEVEGITSTSTGKQIKGWLIACPLTPGHFRRLPERKVYRKIIETGRFAERLGAKLLGLGAFTSIVGDAGITVSRELEIPVTTGDSFTIAIAVEAIRKVARRMEIPLSESSAAVVGATGAIGKGCAELLYREVAELLLVGRRKMALNQLRDHLMSLKGSGIVRTSTNLEDLTMAQWILTMTSSLAAVVDPRHIRPGSVVYDVARPRDVLKSAASTREDILVIDGGMVDVPGPVDFHFDFGFPPGKAYACMAETMALALEGRFEDYTLGKDIDVARVKEIASIAIKHGFRLSDFRSFEQPVTEEHIERVCQNAKKVHR